MLNRKRKLLQRATAISMAALMAVGLGASAASAHDVGKSWSRWSGGYRYTYTVGPYYGPAKYGCDIHTIYWRQTFQPPWDWTSPDNGSYPAWVC